MSKYNPKRLEKYREAVIGLYMGEMQTLIRGKIPDSFNTYVELLTEALPFLDKEIRNKCEKALRAGVQQVEFMRASGVVDSLASGERGRKKCITDFLDEFE